MKRRRLPRLAPTHAGAHLGFGLYAVAAMGLAHVCLHQPIEVVELAAAPAGLDHLLTYYREHNLTGAA